MALGGCVIIMQWVFLFIHGCTEKEPDRLHKVVNVKDLLVHVHPYVTKVTQQNSNETKIIKK